MIKKVTPTVSVIIPTYNRQSLVGRAIQSVLNQTFTGFELIVVDDASADDTASVVASFDDPRITYIRLERNRGVSAARNKGIEVSRGKYIAFLDSDDKWEHQKLEKQLQVFSINKGNSVEVVGCGVSIMQRGSIKYACLPADKEFYEDLLSPSTLPILWRTLLIDKRLLRRTGIRFDEELRTGQDRDFLIRISRVCNITYVNEPLVIFYDDIRIRNTGIENTEQQIKSRLTFIIKYADELHSRPKVLAQRHMSIALLYKRIGNFQAMQCHFSCALKAWHSPKYVLYWIFSRSGIHTFQLFYWVWTRFFYLTSLLRYKCSRLLFRNDNCIR